MALAKNIAASRDWRGFDFKISQVDINNLNAKLNGLNEDLHKKIMMKGLRAGSKVLIIEAKSRVYSDRVEGGIRGLTKTVQGIKGYIVGPSKGFPNPAWLEFGTLDKYTGRGRGKGSYRVKRTKHILGGDGEWFTLRAGREIRGGMRPRPFMRPAFNEKYPAMINKTAEVIGKELKKHGR